MTTKWPGGFITRAATAPSTSVARGMWTAEQVAFYKSQGQWPAPPGQQAYTTPGSYSWVCPPGVTSVSVVVVGSGGINNGGALAYTNNITVSPGVSYPLVVSGASATNSYFNYQGSVSNLYAGNYQTRNGNGGGNGGLGSNGAGGGAGGYAGNGGNGGNSPTSGSGGGGAGGNAGFGAGGGGVGILGQGANGTNPFGQWGGGGSGGTNGDNGYLNCCTGAFSGGDGGSYGGGAASGYSGGNNGTPGRGAVRIIWGSGRSFPSTNTGDV